MQIVKLAIFSAILVVACGKGIKINSPKASEEFLSSIKEISLENKDKSDSCIYSLTYFPPEVNFLKTKKNKITQAELSDFESHKHDVVLFLLDIFVLTRFAC